MSNDYKDNQPKRTPIRQLTAVETRTREEAQKLIALGADTLEFNSKEGTIKATKVHPDGTVEEITRNFCDISQYATLSIIATSDKEARNEEIIRLYKEGYTQQKISSMVGLTQPSIHKILDEAGCLKKP